MFWDWITKTTQPLMKLFWNLLRYVILLNHWKNIWRKIMTMHLVLGMTQNRNVRSQAKMTEKKRAELDQINRQRRREGLVPLTSFAAPSSYEPRRSSKSYVPPRVTSLRAGADHTVIPSADTGVGNAYQVEKPRYTGDTMLGIVVQHKSCLQPVFSAEAARDSASMRR
jgi:hypothetical protein